MSHFWGSSPCFYSEVGNVTVSDDITYLDVIWILNDLNAFFPEDCCDTFNELLDRIGNGECSVTNAFKLLKDNMESNADSLDDSEDEDYWFDGDSSIWETIRMSVKDVTDKFMKEALKKIKFVDFYTNKLIITEKLTNEEMDSVRNLIDVFIGNLKNSEEYCEVEENFSDDDIEYADEDVLEKFIDNRIGSLDVLSVFEDMMNDESFDDVFKSIINKTNFIKIVRQYLSDKELIKFALYNEIYFDSLSDSSEYGDVKTYGITFSDNMEELYKCLKDKNVKFW